jgi:hypothetical protein
MVRLRLRRLRPGLRARGLQHSSVFCDFADVWAGGILAFAAGDRDFGLRFEPQQQYGDFGKLIYVVFDRGAVHGNWISEFLY